ncbi:MAG: hypothetical protein NT154_28895, partial [Verrucomicrobia bacterium]|nr:hypothetical protein [Verrucomicrobiota bacterium]
MHTIANDQRRFRLFGAAEKHGYIFWPMLAVTIEGHCPSVTLRQGSAHACPECRALARVSFPPDNLGSRSGGPLSRLILRTVVHHDYCGQVPLDLKDQPGDC